MQEHLSSLEVKNKDLEKKIKGQKGYTAKHSGDLERRIEEVAKAWKD